MIVTEKLEKSFGEISVLKGIDLRVEDEEIISIVGKSGAGKTTLLQILGTLLPYERGRVLFNGIDISKFSPGKLARFRNKNIGFVFQFHHLLPEFTAFENICIPGYISGTSRKDVEDSAKRLLEMLNIKDRADHKPSELSGGEQQRVAVARALINNPSVILADEPSGNLDLHNKEELHALFFRLREELKQTFVIVTHDPQLAHMSDRELNIVDGVVKS